MAGLIAACGGSGDDDCGTAAQKQWVLDTTRDWYYFDELLPATVDLARFRTAGDLLDFLTQTARVQNKDRFFSFLTTRAEDSAFFGEGEFVGFGFRTRTEPGPRVFVSEVFEPSPASEADVVRGEEIVAVDSGSGFISTAELLASGEVIGNVLGPAEEGLERGLRLADSAGATREVRLAKRIVAIDPVPDDGGVGILPLAGTSGVGYVNLRTYISTADAQLRSAFDGFRAQGIEYFIVDLRYNGGGLITTYELLGDLLGGARDSSDVLARTLFNEKHASDDSTRNFRPQVQSVAPVRIAFLTTEATASASELNVNAILPWIEVAIVGSDTFGKPVGQAAFDLAGCSDRMRLVTFETVNARGEGAFYDGLAPSMTFACAAEDTLGDAQGDPAEGLTAAALQWLSTGACGAVMDAGAAVLQQAGTAASRYPRPARPSAAQIWMPGLQ